MPCSYSRHSLVELPWNGLIFLKANEPAAKREWGGVNLPMTPITLSEHDTALTHPAWP